MKNRSIVFALALTFGLFATSCSDDDNEGETIVPLAGKWNITQVGSVVNGQEVLVPFVDEIILNIDEGKQEIQVNLPEGLLDLYLS